MKKIFKSVICLVLSFCCILSTTAAYANTNPDVQDTNISGVLHVRPLFILFEDNEDKSSYWYELETSSGEKYKLNISDTESFRNLDNKDIEVVGQINREYNVIDVVSLSISKNVEISGKLRVYKLFDEVSPDKWLPVYSYYLTAEDEIQYYLDIVDMECYRELAYKNVHVIGRKYTVYNSTGSVASNWIKTFIMYEE